jgi:hypothetical protein
LVQAFPHAGYVIPHWPAEYEERTNRGYPPTQGVDHAAQAKPANLAVFSQDGAEGICGLTFSPASHPTRVLKRMTAALTVKKDLDLCLRRRGKVTYTCEFEAHRLVKSDARAACENEL